jgi:hypothetical protein
MQEHFYKGPFCCAMAKPEKPEAQKNKMVSRQRNEWRVNNLRGMTS